MFTRSSKQPYKSATAKKTPYQTDIDSVNELDTSTSQKRGENDIWRQKYESQVQQMIQVKANYELEIKSLSQELARLHSLQNEHIRTIENNRSISDAQTIRDKQESAVISELKKSQYEQSNSYEAQLYRFRQQLEDKNQHIAELQTKLNAAKCEYDTLSQRHKNEVDQMHAQLSSIERSHQEQITQLKLKYDFYAQTSHNNVQEAHNSQLELLTEELHKIRHITNIKNAEIETLIQQGQLSKMQHEIEVNSLREEIAQLKSDLNYVDRSSQIAKQDLHEGLEKKHNQQIYSLKTQYQSQINNLQAENHNLRNMMEQKNQELESLNYERHRLKLTHEDEITRMVKDYEAQKQKYDLKENDRQREISDLHIRIERITQNNAENERQLQVQIGSLEKEISSLKDILQARNIEIEDLNIRSSQVNGQLEASILQLREELESTKQRWYESQRDSEKYIEEFTLRLHQTEIHCNDKLKQMERHCDLLQEQTRKTQDMLQIKMRELDQAGHQMLLIENDLQKLKDERDKLIEKIHIYDQEKQLDMEELRMRLENTYCYQIDNLKAAYNTQYSVLQTEITELRAQLAQKQRDYIGLLENQSEKSSKFRTDLSASKAITESILKSRNISYTRK